MKSNKGIHIFIMAILCVVVLCISSGCDACRGCGKACTWACTDGCTAGCITCTQGCVTCSDCTGCTSFCGGCEDGINEYNAKNKN